MSFTFGARSEKELAGVHPDLVRVVRRALELTPIDFGVHDGLRTKEEQAEYVRTGVSWTMNSKHLIQHDGYGHATDLVPYVNGKLRWEWPLIYKLIEAVKQAAIELGVRVRWGGCWQCLNDLGDLEEAVEAYVKLQLSQGKKASTDGPHVELLT